MRKTTITVMFVLAVAVLAGCTTTPDVAATTSALPTTTPTESSVEPTSLPEPSESPTPTPDPSETPSATPTSAIGGVNVEITLAEIETDLASLHVSATMDGISEEGGECTLTASNGTVEATAVQDAIYNVNRTECGGLRIDLDDLESGEWTVVVDYISAKYSGSSAPESVQVP